MKAAMKICVLSGIVAAAVAWIAFAPPLLQSQAYHRFADTRALLAVENAADTLSNLAFLLVGSLGLALLWRERAAGASARFASPQELAPYWVFFAGVALTSAGSAYYHLAPDDARLVWDRLPMTVAFMGLFAALIAEHFSPKLERPVLVSAIAVGIASVILWKLTDDLRVYIWVQAAPLLLIVCLAACFPGRYTHRHYLLYGVGFYALAKVAEYYDHGIHTLTSAAISGHSLKHLLAAAAPFCVYLMLKRRTPLQHEGERRKAEGGRVG
jgi:hypothetical protein